MSKDMTTPRKSGDLGAPIKSSRDRLLEAANFTPEEQAALTRKVIDRTTSLLDAEETKYFSFEGEVRDQRTGPDNGCRLAAVDASARLLGLSAPKANQKVEVVYRVELPEWALPDGVPAQVIDITPTPTPTDEPAHE